MTEHDTTEQEPMLDPTVAALLSDDLLSATASTNEIKTRMGMIRLQQARIHGNATYAATVLEHALSESQKSRNLHERLTERLAVLERHVSTIESTDATSDNSRPLGSTSRTAKLDESGASTLDGNSSEAQQLTDDEADQSIDEEKDAMKDHIRELEIYVEGRIKEEIESIQEDRKYLHDHEIRLRRRTKNLRNTIAERPHLANSETLQAALATTNEYATVSTLVSECVVCKENGATRAIIPCGHLCLCDTCTSTLLERSSTLQYCPLCRGNLLSTLKIYTMK